MTVSYQLSSTQLSVVQGLFDSGDYPAAYQYISDAMIAGGGDAATAAWFSNAAQINANSGSFISEYVRNYTEIAGAYLNGKPITDSEFQSVSNSLAQNLLEGIINKNGVIPDSETIIQNDIEAAINGFHISGEGFAGVLSPI